MSEKSITAGSKMFWPLQENILTDNDLDVLVNFIKTTKRFTQFENVRAFEEAFCKWQKCQFSVFVNSGSSANLILLSAAMEVYNWSPGDEIIVPSVTWTTTVTPVIQLGLKPIFVDVNLLDLSLDYSHLERVITPKTKGIFLAHLLGFPSDIDKIKSIIGSREIKILEDCCESQGATIGQSKVGNFGCGGTFSFYWGHHMTTVEGGMVCTNDELIYKMLLLKRSHGLARELPKKYHEEIKNAFPDLDFNFLFLTDGFNVRNTELSAILGLEQLPRMDSFINQRNLNYDLFIKHCEKFKKDLIVIDKKGKSSFVLPFFFKEKNKMLSFRNKIIEHGIESRPLISGNLLRQPFLKDYFNQSDFMNAEFIHFNSFYIGNNQFVNEKRLKVLFDIMDNFFD